jgi:hypothetical protein
MFHARYISGVDPGNFVLAIKYGHSIAQERPHEPGYPGFYLLWKGVAFVTMLSPYHILLACNIAFALIGIGLSYWGAKRLFDEHTAFLSALFVASNPLLLYFTCTGELYAYDVAFSAFVVVMLLAPPRKYSIALYFVYGLLGAFRLSSVILTLPVVVFVLALRYNRKRNTPQTLMNLIALVAGTGGWLLPYVHYLGGWPEFLIVMRGAAFLPTTLAQNILTVIPWMIWMLNLIAVVILWNAKKLWGALRTRDERVVVLILLILVPALFFTLKYYAKGYGLLYLPEVAMLCAYLIKRKPRWVVPWVLGILALNLAIFFMVPYVEPSVRSTLNYSHRTMRERWESVLLRSISFYAPTHARLCADDAAMIAARSILDSIPADSYLIIENSPVHPRSLQTEYPRLCFLRPRTDDSEHYQSYHGGMTRYDFQLTDLPDGAHVFVITTRTFIREVSAPPGNLLCEKSGIQLYALPKENRNELSQFFRTFFFRRAGT